MSGCQRWYMLIGEKTYHGVRDGPVIECITRRAFDTKHGTNLSSSNRLDILPVSSAYTLGCYNFDSPPSRYCAS
jgi:hypothetical protein